MTIKARSVAGQLIGRRVQTTSLMKPATVQGAQGQTNAMGYIASSDAVRDAAKSQLHGKFLESCLIQCGDADYYLPTMQEVRTILAQSQTDRYEWLQERFDCDDFAYVLKGEMSQHAYAAPSALHGLCVGMIWADFSWLSGYHAVNWFMADDGVIRFIEPQDDTIYDAQKCQGRISLCIV